MEQSQILKQYISIGWNQHIFDVHYNRCWAWKS